VTFAFTDIEGSTQRWDLDREAMQQALRRHDELVRPAIEAHAGRIFKTMGDEFCAAFARPEDAVAAMLEVQRALKAGDFSAVDGLRVRAAIHTGTADERDGDYYGPPVNRVARLLTIAHGGQILVSGATADLVQGELPKQASLRDLGEHRLRDLARPEYVYQLLAPDLTAEFPPLRSLDVLSNNLPFQFTSLIGREAEIREITALVERHRLVTLVGSAGVGKTRTSLQVAANLLDGSGDGVWFIELAPLASGEYIPSTVAHTLGITLPSEGDPIANLTHTLKDARMLLVFDNCEHLVEPAARVISAILRECPKIKVIASSRQGLGIAAEETYRLPSLAVPEAADLDGLPASEAIQSAAIALFVERARTVDKKFVLTDDNAPAVAEICRRLDGIPLAIELAASRVKMLSPSQLRARLDERFRVLTGGSRDVLPRQQTLRALIGWSHDLLDERERVLFRRLGIFVNGFTLEGAMAVASDESDEFDVFDVLASLVDKSLVLAEPDKDSLRYRLLESTRAYALQKLAEAGEHDLLATRHLRYLRDHFVEVEKRLLQTARESEHQAAFESEAEDIRAALDYASRQADTARILEGSELLAAIREAWKVGFVREGTARVVTFLELLPVDETLLRARLSTELSGLQAGQVHKARALASATQAVACARAIGNSEALGEALTVYAWACLGLHRADDAERALVEAEAIPSVTPWLRIQLQGSRAFLSSLRDDDDAALGIWERLRTQHRSLGNLRSERRSALMLAEIEHGRGQTQRSIALAREVLAERRFLDPPLAAAMLSNLAGYLLAEDDVPGSADAARESIRIFVSSQPGHDHGQAVFSVEHLALAAALRGDLPRAAVLEGYADATIHATGSEREHTETVTYDRLTALLTAGLPPSERERLAAEGAALTPEAATALALEGA
jgi:predicted ATPase/class 3 adenylate cyclase